MKKSVKKIWIKALRSGEYEQGQRALCRQDLDGKTKYCCLGVLANEILDTFWVPVERDDGYKNTHYRNTTFWKIEGEDQSSYFQHKELEILGLTGIQQNKLARMNDLEELSFAKIADWIERYIYPDA